MKHRDIFRVGILCVVMAVMFGNLNAQQGQTSKNRRIGSAAATELLIPVGAQGMAMGGASIAVSEGVESIHWNPAGLARIGYGAEAMVSSMSYIADIQVNYGAVAIKFGGFGVVGLSVRALNFGEISMTTNDDPDGDAGRTYSPNFMTLGLSYSRQFTDAITVGGTFKVISEKIARSTGSAFAVDVGVQYHGAGGIKGLNFGLALKNYGPQMSFAGTGFLRRAKSPEGRRPEQYYRVETSGYELPSQMEMGLAYDYPVNEDLSVTVNGSFVNDNLALNSYRFGGQVAYTMGNFNLFGRGGYEYAPGNKVDEFIFGPTVGFGIKFKTEAVDLTLDYAWRQTEYFNDNSVFALRFGF